MLYEAFHAKQNLLTDPSKSPVDCTKSNTREWHLVVYIHQPCPRFVGYSPVGGGVVVVVVVVFPVGCSRRLLVSSNDAPAALAYADEKDHKHPYVSPVYGDFFTTPLGGFFPPTLIQGGTKEIFLSNFVRLYQAIDQAGGGPGGGNNNIVKLDIYEGMPHVFQSALPNSMEAQAAITKVRKWIEQHALL